MKNTTAAGICISLAAAFYPAADVQAQSQDIQTSSEPVADYQYRDGVSVEAPCDLLWKFRNAQNKITNLVVTCEFAKQVDKFKQDFCYYPDETAETVNRRVFQTNSEIVGWSSYLSYNHFFASHNFEAVAGTQIYKSGLGMTEQQLKVHSSPYVRNYTIDPSGWNGETPLTDAREACVNGYKALGLWAD